MVPENSPIQLESAAADREVKSEVMFEKTLPLSEAVAYFEAIILGLKNGSIHMRQGDTDLTLKPTTKVAVEIRAGRRKKKEGFSFEISWSPSDSEKLTIS